jgi:hypothetical protein
MAIKTMSAGNGTGQWAEGWHELTVRDAKYGTWNDKKYLDVLFEGYPDSFNLRIYEAVNKETHEEFALAKFFKVLNAGIIDKIKSPSGKEAIQYDDAPEGLNGKRFNGLFYKDSSGYNKVSPRVAPVKQTGKVISYTDDDVGFWKKIAEKHRDEFLLKDKSTNTENTTTTDEDIPF